MNGLRDNYVDKHRDCQIKVPIKRLAGQSRDVESCTKYQL